MIEDIQLITLTLNCNSGNVVYLNTCKKCSLQYVGSTITKFRLRFNNQFNDQFLTKYSNRLTDQPLSKHISIKYVTHTVKSEQGVLISKLTGIDLIVYR